VLVRAIGGHACGEDDGARDAKRDEGASGHTSAVEGAEHLVVMRLEMCTSL